MTPEDLYYRYCGRPCRMCKETIHTDDEFIRCDSCNKLLCEDCHVKAQFSCHVCAEKLETGQDYDLYNRCKHCLERCKTCGLHHHRECTAEHHSITACSRLGRAQRKLALATKRVQYARGALAKAKNELQEAKLARVNAEKKLLQLQRSELCYK